MFPATTCFFFPSCNILPMSVVVVVFPFVPVTATIGAGQNQLATSSSLTILNPRPAASRTIGLSEGTPGLNTRRSFPKSRSECAPVSNPIPAERSSASCGWSFSGAALSLTNTIAPFDVRSFATATPLRAAPMTAMRFPRTSMPVTAGFFISSATSVCISILDTPLVPMQLHSGSPHFKRRQAEDHQKNGDDIKSRDDLRLGPSAHLEMMVERRHLEDAPSFTVLPARVLEVITLDDHRDCFHQEHSAERRQQKLFLDQDAERTDRASKGKRPRIAHKDLRREGVKPQESQRSTHESRTVDAQFPVSPEERDREVLAEIRTSGNIGHHRKRQCDDADSPGRKPVQPVGEVHRVARSDNHEDDHRDVEHSEVHFETLEERNRRARLDLPEVDIDELGVKVNGAADHEADQDLADQFVLFDQAFALFFHNFQIIVEKSHGPERCRYEQDQENVSVPEVRPEQRRHQRRGKNDQAAHRRRSSLAQMRLRGFQLRRFPDLMLLEHVDNFGSQPERNDERSHRGSARPEREI